MANPLQTVYSGFLEKDEVGKVRSPRYQLPHSDFTYGKALDRDIEGARDVIKTWTFHSPSRAPSKSTDFRVLNKMSLKNGFTESKGVYDFRRTHTAFENVRVGQNTIKIVLPEEEFPYGTPNRPSTPINAVIHNEYGMRAALLTQEMYRTRREEAGTFKNVALPKLNNTARVAKEKVQQRINELYVADQKPLFKIKKFLATSPRIETKNLQYIANLKASKTPVPVANKLAV